MREREREREREGEIEVETICRKQKLNIFISKKLQYSLNLFIGT